MKNIIEQTRKRTQDDHYVVAIGASAGGLESIHEFFDNMPETGNLSFVVIQHLSPDYKSLLVELVSKHTQMKVLEAAHGMNIETQCVYIIPNNRLMTVSKNQLMLEEKHHLKGPNTAIDIFLKSLGEDKKDKAIAIILSGTGTDGSRGIETIKSCGGMVIVQDPLTARFDGMPNSAIATGNADFILAPDRMPAEISEYLKETPIPIVTQGKADDNLLDDIFQMISEFKGHDFQFYKTPTIIRRIGRRMLLGGFQTLSAYVAHLKLDTKELEKLSEDFLINVTQFFRDHAAFTVIKTQVIPQIVDHKKDGDTVKIWISACSTGEESYSIAILLDEYIKRKSRTLDVKIFASDIDEKCIESAAKNAFTSAAVRDVPNDLLEKYFIKDGSHYSVIPLIRKQIVFAKHNIIKDPPFIKNDLVTCRNMLIYMNSVLQKKVLYTLHFALEKNGYLFLGSSETASFIRQGIEEVNSKWKIYRKTGPAGITNADLYRGGQDNSRGPRIPIPRKDPPAGSRLQEDFNKLLLEDEGYVVLSIDANYEIKETLGNFSKFLSLPEKKLLLNLFKMVRPELSVALNTGIRKAQKEQKNIELKNVRIKDEKGDYYLNILVKPANEQAGKPYTLIVLKEETIQPKDKTGEAVTVSATTEHNEYISELESELSETRTNLQMAIESLETTNEELQSSNEELLSANEELQSSNEELQSLNEELHTLNTEHQLKIKELIDLNDDLNNYFRSTEIAQIFVDQEMKIRKFNPASVRIINVIESDIGRPINHISNNLNYNGLVEDIKKIIKKETAIIEKELTVSNGNITLMRMQPYLRMDKEADGVIISFVDITAAHELNSLVKGVFNASTSGIMVFKAIRNKGNEIEDFECKAMNHSSEKYFSREASPIGKTLKEFSPESIKNGFFEKYRQVAETGEPFDVEYCSEIENKTYWLLVNAVKMQDGFVVTFTDITEKKEAEQNLRKNFEELVTVKENLKDLNEQLEEKIYERTKQLSESDERFRFVSSATNDAVWDWNLQTDEVWWNGNFYKMFGYEKNDLTGNMEFRLDKIHPEDKEKTRESIYRVIDSKESQWSAEYRLCKADGSYAHILDRGYILKDDFGKPYRMIGSMMDVSEIIRANQELERTEIRFRQLADSIPQKVWTANPNGELVYFNQQWIDYTGRDMTGLEGNGWEEIIHPDDIKRSIKLWKEAVKNSTDFETENRLLSHDGSYRWHLTRAIAQRDNSDHVVMWVGTNTDIHDQKANAERLKRSEDHFREIADQSPFMIWKVDTAGICNYVNKQWCEFTGIAYEQSLGRGWDGAIHPEDRKREYEKFMHSFNQRIPYSSKFRIRRHDGQYRWVYSLSNPLSEGEFSGYIGSLTDITEQELNQQATTFLLQKKDEFMSIASHELKTPITSMKASLQIVERLSANDKGLKPIHAFVEKANKQVNRLTRLVEDLLDVTKIQAGKLLFNKSYFNIRTAVMDCVDQVQNNTESHKIVLKGDTDITIYGDRHRLEQVINNLLVNGIKYSPDGDRIIVQIKKQQDCVEVSITDFGIGIPQDKVPYIFDRFFRVQESSTNFSGLGLGLFISAEIVKRHGGDIGVKSETGKGSQFWFTLPLSQYEEPAASANLEMSDDSLSVISPN
ncbi:MAG: chemotaxis protein [Chitinophagaceae bacterium]|nr:chemotaxis protein [Chitinophagaceae bacterium]